MFIDTYTQTFIVCVSCATEAEVGETKAEAPFQAPPQESINSVVFRPQTSQRLYWSLCNADVF